MIADSARGPTFFSRRFERRRLLAIAIGRAAALRAATTSQAARYLRKQSEIGSGAPGCFADLLVNGDPLSDVRDLRKFTTVYKGGVEYYSAKILAAIPANPNYHCD